jgi:hypothetical protein
LLCGEIVNKYLQKKNSVHLLPIHVLFTVHFSQRKLYIEYFQIKN